MSRISRALAPRLAIHLSFALLFASAAPSQDIVPGRYIVELGVELAIEPAASATQKAVRRAAVQSDQRRLAAALEARGVEIAGSVDSVANALFVNASEDQAAQIAVMPGVSRVKPVRLYRKLLDRVVILQHVTDAWAQIGGTGEAGRNIRIGIIDTGIDASHPAFSDASLQIPDGFPKVNRDIDLRNTNSKVIVARNYDTRNSANDVEGHGTGVAMIAAGVTHNGARTAITGIAPKAFLGNYKVFPDEGDGAPSDAVLKALDDAFNDGMDVVNLSLGSFPAERFSEDPLAQAVDRAAKQGMIVVVAAGNEGPDLNTIASPATAPSAISVGNASSDRIFASSAAFEGGEAFIAVPGSGRNSSSPIRAAVADIASIDATGLACSTLTPGSLAGKIALVLRGTCFFEQKLTNLQGAGAVAALVYAREENPEPISMSVGAARLPAAMVSHADGLRIKTRIGENPDLPLTLDFSRTPFPVDPSRLNSSSSKGPNNDLTIKPDLIAVGSSVYTAALGSGYIVGSGTSFSAPSVAGAAAVLKSARPGLTADDYRSLLVNSVEAFNSALPLPHTGSGLLNLAAALRGSTAANPHSIAFNAGGGTVDVTRTFSLRNISNAADTFTITVVPTTAGAVPAISTNTVQLAPGASEQISIRLSGTNLSARAYEGVLTVRGTRSDVAARIPYWYAATSPRASTISVIAPESPAAPSSNQRIRFKVLDEAGVPLQVDPKVTADAGGGLVMSVDSQDALYPGVYLARVRLGDTAGENVFAIEAGGVMTRVSITTE